MLIELARMWSAALLAALEASSSELERLSLLSDFFQTPYGTTDLWELLGATLHGHKSTSNTHTAKIRSRRP